MICGDKLTNFVALVLINLQFLTENSEFTVVGVIGPPGVGKSTIMNELYGFDATSPGGLGSLISSIAWHIAVAVCLVYSSFMRLLSLITPATQGCYRHMQHSQRRPELWQDTLVWALNPGFLPNALYFLIPRFTLVLFLHHSSSKNHFLWSVLVNECGCLTNVPFLYDKQPVFSPSVLAEMMRPDGSSTIPVLSGESLSAELAHEVMSIQVTKTSNLKKFSSFFFFSEPIIAVIMSMSHCCC